ncbi:MAG: glucose-1-phosphate adenylyltransferase [Rhodocyclales bacterium]|nr:glucose-1-phosphate adenylyltransferase [Rhodocyclales bacterium]
MPYPKVLAMVMAGGEGARLYPLTAERSKPAVPFAGRYRIVDFVLSNLVNSEIHSIYLLVQYKSQSLIEHISRAWTLSHVIPGQFVAVVPPQMREGPEWFQGTADAVYQNRNLILQHRPALVAVFGADHIYRMDVRQMVRFHQERRAQVTVAALPVPLERARDLGIIAAEPDGRVLDFREKPAEPPSMPGRPDYAYASMGNYLFDTAILIEALEEARRRGESDFGRHVLPRLIGECRVCGYDFSRNEVPGVREYEEPAYWRDVGTIDAYYAANMDTLGAQPRFNLFNPLWFINSSNYQGPVPRILEGHIYNSCLGAGTVVDGGTIRNSIIRREVLIERDVEIEDSIVMDFAIIRRGVRLRRVIVDRYNEIAAGGRIGFDPDADRQRYPVTGSGVTVIPKGSHVCGPFHYF